MFLVQNVDIQFSSSGFPFFFEEVPFFFFEEVVSIFTVNVVHSVLKVDVPSRFI